MPKEFQERMKENLGENFDKYMLAVDEAPVRGLRVNTTRISVDEYLKKYNKNLESIEYARDGFVFNDDDKIGFSAEHLSGLVYLQEPSSMLAVCASEIEKDNRPLKVLDLCASPGGKTGQRVFPRQSLFLQLRSGSQ